MALFRESTTNVDPNSPLVGGVSGLATGEGSNGF